MPTLSPARLAALRAAADGRVFRGYSSGGHRIVWWIDRSPEPRNVTMTAEVEELLEAGLLKPGPINADLRLTAVPADAGRELLDSLDPEGR